MEVNPVRLDFTKQVADEILETPPVRYSDIQCLQSFATCLRMWESGAEGFRTCAEFTDSPIQNKVTRSALSSARAATIMRQPAPNTRHVKPMAVEHIANSMFASDTWQKLGFG